jgi:hypothetical protein
MLIGRDDIGYCHDKVYSVMWIGKNVTGSFHDEFEVLFGLEELIQDDVLT